MRENLPPALVHTSAFGFRIGDLIVRKHCVYVIVSWTARSDTTRQNWVATGFYFWSDIGSWESPQVYETSFEGWQVTR